MIRKVAIIGPESTGKSTLSMRLASHYQTLWVPEYARQYLESRGSAYTYDSLLEIAKGQVKLEDEYIKRLENGHPDNDDSPTLHSTSKSSTSDYQNTNPDTHRSKGQTPLLIIDTEMYVMKVWSEFVFQKCHQWIIDQAASRQYDLFFLCNIDLPWTYDVLREYPNPEPRQQLFRMYHDILINQSVPWTVISGEYDQRLSLAIESIDRIL